MSIENVEGAASLASCAAVTLEEPKSSTKSAERVWSWLRTRRVTCSGARSRSSSRAHGRFRRAATAEARSEKASGDIRILQAIVMSSVETPLYAVGRGGDVEPEGAAARVQLIPIARIRAPRLVPSLLTPYLPTVLVVSPGTPAASL